MSLKREESSGIYPGGIKLTSRSEDITGSLYADVTIKAADMSAVNITSTSGTTPPSIDWTGGQLNPMSIFTLKLGSKTLVDGVDYDWYVTPTSTSTRQFVAATDKQAYTICLPYDLTLPASVEIYTLSASKDDQVGFAKLATNEIKALTPYLIILTMSGQLLNLSGGNIKKTNATLVAANDATSVAVSGQQRGGIYIINGKKVLVK